jgi:type I restriction enzyme S subunit
MNQLGKPHGSLGVSQYEGIISPAYFVAEIGPAADPRFVHHLLRTRLYISEYERRGKYMPPSQFDISWDQFRQIEVVLPPFEQQRAIADYLDTETTRIDALITKKRRMIEVLDERRQSVVSAAIWGSHGRVRLKHLGIRPTSGNRDHGSFVEDEQGVPCLRGLNVKAAKVNRDALLRISRESHAAQPATQLRSGDLIVVRSGAAGAAAVVPEDLDGCNCVDLVVLRQSPNVVPRFLEYVINSREAQEQVTQGSTGAILTHFNAVDAAELWVPNLDPQEQASVVAHLDGVDTQVSGASERLSRQINLLAEHRQALITAAVTGELSVPGVAA